MPGHKLNQGGICPPPPPSKYASGEIQNSMFLPLMRKALMGGIGGRRQNLSLLGYNKLFLLKMESPLMKKILVTPLYRNLFV